MCRRAGHCAVHPSRVSRAPRGRSFTRCRPMSPSTLDRRPTGTDRPHPTSFHQTGSPWQLTPPTSCLWHRSSSAASGIWTATPSSPSRKTSSARHATSARPPSWACRSPSRRARNSLGRSHRPSWTRRSRRGPPPRPSWRPWPRTWSASTTPCACTSERSARSRSSRLRRRSSSPRPSNSASNSLAAQPARRQGAARGGALEGRPLALGVDAQ